MPEFSLPRTYFESIADELTSVRNRVRMFIGAAHWSTDGEWKESVLRSVIRRHMIGGLRIGKGFVLSPTGLSTQIDVLIYDASYPVLFQDSDLVIVTADAVRGIIEVKTSIDNTRLKQALEKLATIAELVRARLEHPVMLGLFSYENETTDATRILADVRSAAGGNAKRVVNLLSIGPNLFARYWELNPLEGERWQCWHAYDLPRSAQGYFLHNVVEHLNPKTVQENTRLWYPAETKELHKSAQITL